MRKNSENKIPYIIGLGLVVIVWLAAGFLWFVLFGILAMSAVPSDMPVRWSLICITPTVLIGHLIGEVIAYRRRSGIWLIILPITTVLYMAFVFYFFTNLGNNL